MKLHRTSMGYLVPVKSALEFFPMVGVENKSRRRNAFPLLVCAEGAHQLVMLQAYVLGEGIVEKPI